MKTWQKITLVGVSALGLSSFHYMRSAQRIVFNTGRPTYIQGKWQLPLYIKNPTRYTYIIPRLFFDVWYKSNKLGRVNLPFLITVRPGQTSVMTHIDINGAGWLNSLLSFDSHKAIVIDIRGRFMAFGKWIDFSKKGIKPIKNI